MTKLRKQRRRKKYRYNVNRKRLRNKINSSGKIGCQEISKEWDSHKSMQINLKEMGLSYNPNQTIKIERIVHKKTTEVTEMRQVSSDNIPLSKQIVAEKLLEDAKAPKMKMLRLPGSHIEWVTYLMDKYKNDYRAMSRDKRNYNQETWKQIRQKVRAFKNIPKQYSQYLKNRGIEDEDEYGNVSSDGEI